jgi:multidrug resistance efflux pump
MTETQVKKTRLEVARAEAELAKAEAPKAPDPRRAVAEDTVRTLETLLQRTEAAYKAGTAGEAEVLNARVRLNEAKLKLLELGDPPPPAAKRPPDLDADIAANRRDLDRAKDLLKRGIMTLEEVNRLREELTRLEAYAARAGDDFAAARKHREAAVVELETRVKNLQALVERKAASRGELRAAEVALAEARVEALKAGVRQQLASIVTSREEELREVRALHELKAVSSEEVRRAELAVTEARARLAAER